MASIEIEVQMPRRRATAYISPYLSRIHSIPEGEQECHVLGAFQITDYETNSFYPVFVCEFNDGKVLNLATDLIKFTDTEGGTLL